MPRLPPATLEPADIRADEREDDREVLSSRQARILTPLLIASVIILPLQIPRYGRLQLTPADGPILLFMVVAAAAFWRSRTRLRLPLGGGFLLILLGGALALGQSLVPTESAGALAQDLYLFSWFVLAVTVIALSRTTASKVALFLSATGAVVGAYTWLATLWCPEFVPSIFGHPGANQYCRSLGAFRDPNLAGFYLAVTFFVLWASPRPAHRLVKLLWSLPILLGLYATQSITALVVIVAGTVVALAVGFVTRRETAVAAALAVIGLTLTAVAALPADFDTTPRRVLGSLAGSDVFEQSLGRTNTSVGTRAQRWEEALQFFGSSVLIGIGPSATDDALLAQNAPISGELHNDYIAGFLERGVIGGLGVLIIFGAVGVWTLRVATDKRLGLDGWRPAAFAGATTAVVLTALSLETLHFRHVWLYFALIVALGLAQRDRELEEADPAASTS